ncbi:MAG: Rieske (2Fe-2S) protein [Mizugakiibacter sp.]|uniref:Rieske (2Fe-2S) protein n=1 Tax=Mizugakiibacter sp. TaxID=1972610 RepID=UPI0031C51D1F|nr:Rieske (2Fe-2S) protein [Xanthomonadaceae bacterium]
MDRRQFVEICAGAVAALAAGTQPSLADGIQDYPGAKLVDAQGAPLKASELATDQAYLFHYPFNGVPCFLINLGKAGADDGRHARPGGAGTSGRLVSYVAICTHQLSYPNRATSVIRYAAEGSELAGKPGMIVCCAHGSVFDPSAGARKVSGPAEQPLVAVRLQHDPSDDSLSATGIAGSELIGRFFNAYKADLIAQYGPGVYRQSVGDTATAVPLDSYSGVVPRC